MILLQPKLSLVVDHHMPKCPVKLLAADVKVRVTTKVQNVIVCPDRVLCESLGSVVKVKFIATAHVTERRLFQLYFRNC